MPEAPVTPEVVKWAIDESGMSVENIASRLAIEPADVEAWMAADSGKPTKGQLTDLADTLRRPRAMFFLSEPPAESSLPDGLRKPAGQRARGMAELTFDERLWARRAKRLQGFLRSLSNSEVHIPAAEGTEDPQDVGERLRAWTGVTAEAQREWKSPAKAFHAWREALEAMGVAVLALPLGKEAVQGFALSDDCVPLIGINTAAIHEARSFTLFHELAHLALRGDSSCAETSTRGIEAWCESVASTVLVPRAQLRVLAASAGLEGLNLVKHAASHFKASHRAAAVALEDIGAVEDAYAQVLAAWPTHDREKRGGGGGEGRRSPQKCLDEYGGFAVGTVIRAWQSRRIGELVASDYLHLDRTQLPDVGQLLAERPA